MISEAKFHAQSNAVVEKISRKFTDCEVGNLFSTRKIVSTYVLILRGRRIPLTYISAGGY